MINNGASNAMQRMTSAQQGFTVGSQPPLPNGRPPQEQGQMQQPMPFMQGQQQPTIQRPPVASPLDLLLSNATSDEKTDKEVSLKNLKKAEIDKIMRAFTKCKKIADAYYTSTIEPKLKNKENAFYANEEYFKQRFPELSELSKFCSRDIKTTINWMIPNLMEALNGGDDPVDLKGVSIEDDDKAEKVQTMLKYQLQRKNNYNTFLNSVILDGLKFNYGLAKVFWKREEDRQRYKIMVSENDMDMLTIMYQEVQKGSIEIIEAKPVKDAPDLSVIVFEKVTITANYPVISYLPPSEMRYTPDGTSIQTAKFKAHRKIVTGDYLKRKEQEGVYENVDKALEKSHGNTNRTTYDTDKNDELGTIGKRISDDDIASKEAELYEGYIDVDYNNDGIMEHLIVHAVDDTPIRIQKNDFDMTPFFPCYCEYSPNTAFNKKESFIDDLEQQQDVKTAVFRQVLINVAKTNVPQKFVDERKVDMDALLDGEEIVPCRDDVSRCVAIPAQPALNPLSMTVVQYAQNEIEAQSGSTKYDQGLDANSLNSTATGITAIMGSTQKRMRHLAKQIAENFIVPLMRYVIMLNQKYMDNEQMVRLMNENIVITKDDLNVDFDFIISVGEGAGTKEAKIQYLMLAINQLMPQLTQQGVAVPQSWYELTNELWQEMGMRNSTKYLRDPKSPEAQEAIKAEQAAQQQQMQQQLELQKTLLEIERLKAQPKVATKLPDLPLDAQQQFIADKLNLRTSPQALMQKELNNNAQKTKTTTNATPNTLY